MRTLSPCRLAIIGLGSLGGAVLQRLVETPPRHIELVAVCDLTTPQGRTAQLLSGGSVPFVGHAADLMQFSPECVLETASVAAAAEAIPLFLGRGVWVISLSAGCLADAGLLSRALQLCRPTGPRLIIPSGAVGGLDILKAAATGSLHRVHLRTTKPASSLPSDEENAPGRRKTGPAVLYRGTAAEAAGRFPRNINVAMSVALAGLGPEATTVEIVADPACTENTHQLFIEGDFGAAEITLRNRPSPGNPRSSLLAFQSVMAVLEQFGSGLQVGS